jgi:hypothetical protein
LGNFSIGGLLSIPLITPEGILLSEDRISSSFISPLENFSVGGLLSIPLITPEGIVLSEDRISYPSTYFPLWGNFSVGGLLSIPLIIPEGIVLAEDRGYLIPLFPPWGTFL